MKLRVLNALLFAGVAIWMLFRQPWASPGLLLLSASWLVIPVAAWRGAEGRAAVSALVLYISLGYLGLAYLLALIVGWPTTSGFWAVFGAAVLILGPILWLGKRVVLGEPIRR